MKAIFSSPITHSGLPEPNSWLDACSLPDERHASRWCTVAPACAWVDLSPKGILERNPKCLVPCQWILYLKSCSHQHVVQQVQVWPRRPQVVGGRMVGVHPEAQILLLKKKKKTLYFSLLRAKIGAKSANLMSVMRQLWTVPRTGSKSCHPLDWFDP